MTSCQKAIAASRSFWDQGVFDAPNQAVVAKCIRDELKLLTDAKVSQKDAEDLITKMIGEEFPGLRIESPFEIISVGDFSMWNMSVRYGLSKPIWVNHVS